MTTSTANPTPLRLEATFGPGRKWTSQAGSTATAWEMPAFHLLWSEDVASEGDVRRLWEAGKGRQAYPVVLLAPSEDESKSWSLGRRTPGPFGICPLPASSTCWKPTVT